MSKNCALLQELVFFYSCVMYKEFYEICYTSERAIKVTTIILLKCATLRERIVRCLTFDAFTLLPQLVEVIEESKI